MLDFSPLVGAVIVSRAISWIGEKPVSLTRFGTIFTVFTFPFVGRKTKLSLGVKGVSIGTRLSYVLSADALAEDVSGASIGAGKRGELVLALSCTDPANRMACIEVSSLRTCMDLQVLIPTQAVFFNGDGSRASADLVVAALCAVLRDTQINIVIETVSSRTGIVRLPRTSWWGHFSYFHRECQAGKNQNMLGPRCHVGSG